MTSSQRLVRVNMFDRLFMGFYDLWGPLRKRKGSGHPKHLANVLSISRLLSGGLSLWLGFKLPSHTHHGLYITLTIVSVAYFALSDGGDGAMARYLGIHTPFGNLIDPTIDKIATFMFLAGWIIASSHIGGAIFLVTVIMVAARLVFEAGIVLFAAREEKVNPDAKAGLAGKIKLTCDCLIVMVFTKVALIAWDSTAAKVCYTIALVALAATYVLSIGAMRYHARGHKTALEARYQRLHTPTNYQRPAPTTYAVTRPAESNHTR